MQWLLSHGVPSATLVEAADDLFSLLQATIAQAHGPWNARKQVVGPDSATVLFHVANLSSENGLVEPESMQSIWPGLRTRWKQTRQAIALSELLQDDVQVTDWLILDCVAAPLLLNSLQTFEGDVLVLRESAMSGNQRSSIITQLGDANNYALQEICRFPTRNPKVWHTLFVREHAREARTLKREIATLTNYINNTKAKAEEAQKNLIEARDRIQSLEEQTTKMSREIRQKEHEISHLQHELDIKTSEKLALNFKLSLLDQENTNAKVHTARLQDIIKQLQDHSERQNELLDRMHDTTLQQSHHILETISEILKTPPQK